VVGEGAGRGRGERPGAALGDEAGVEGVVLGGHGVRRRGVGVGPGDGVAERHVQGGRVVAGGRRDDPGRDLPPAGRAGRGRGRDGRVGRDGGRGGGRDGRVGRGRGRDGRVGRGRGRDGRVGGSCG